MQTQKRAGAGAEHFSVIIDGNFYYVDKTKFLRPVFTTQGSVMLFTRPRRFGKTLTLSMFKEFFDVNPENPETPAVRKGSSGDLMS